MLFLMILFLFTKAACTPESNGGSVLFYKRSSKECWNQDDLAKLRARKIFEKIMLPALPTEKMNSKYNRDMVKYYRKALQVVDSDTDPHNAYILKEALADTIGGHMRSKILPTVRFSYYAGYVPFKSAKQMHAFYDELKTFLNTQGIGWNPPEKTPIQTNMTVGKILIGAGKPFDPCAFLVVKRDENNCIHIPTPKVDDETEPTAIVLPFKVGGFVSLVSHSSENILLKYYTTAARCILRSSPPECKHTDFVNFNNELWHWMKRHVAPHLLDEKLYPAYGGVLRIAAAVQNYGKGLSRRNLYEEDLTPNKWCPWKALKNQQLSIDADWTPQLYIALILGAALAICCLQICYNYILGRASGCRCSGRKRSYSKEVAYATVDSTFPAMLPSHQSGPSSVDKRDRDHRSLPRSKSASVGTIRTRVYDFNENTEKIMSVIMSDNEGSDIDSTSDKESEEEVRTKTGIGSVQTQTNVKPRSPRSPPKIEAPIAQLKIEKTAQAEKARPMCSTSTVTQSEVTYCGQVSDTAWSGSYTTESSVSTKSHTQRTRRSRDLAWARRVVSKHTVNDSTNQKSFTGTDFDLNSFTTPPSRR